MYLPIYIIHALTSAVKVMFDCSVSFASGSSSKLSTLTIVLDLFSFPHSLLTSQLYSCLNLEYKTISTCSISLDIFSAYLVIYSHSRFILGNLDNPTLAVFFILLGLK